MGIINNDCSCLWKEAFNKGFQTAVDVFAGIGHFIRLQRMFKTFTIFCKIFKSLSRRSAGGGELVVGGS